MSKFTVHVHKRKLTQEDTYILAVQKFEHDTYEEAERFASSVEGMLVKVFDELGQILLSLVPSNDSITSDYV